MDEEFIFQVTEEELAQFPEEGDQSQEEQSPLEHQQELELKEKVTQLPTEKQEDNKVKIPSLLNLKLPRLYAASRNGRWNKGPSAEKERRRGSSKRRGCQSSPQPRGSPTKQPRWRQPSCHPRWGKKMRQEMNML